MGHLARRGAALAGPREGNAMKGKPKCVHKAVHSVLDTPCHFARGAIRPECELRVRTSSDDRDKFLHEVDVSPCAGAVGIAEYQYRRHLKHQYEGVLCRRDGCLYVSKYRAELRGLTSDNIEDEEGVALFREGGTADVELDPTRSGGRLVSGGTASMAERYRNEMKFNLNSKTS